MIVMSIADFAKAMIIAELCSIGIGIAGTLAWIYSVKLWLRHNHR